MDLILQYFSRLLLTLLKNKHKTFNGSFDLPLISLVLEFAFFSNAYTRMVKWKDFILFSSSAFERKENLCGMPNTVTIVMNIKFWNLHSYKYARNYFNVEHVWTVTPWLWNTILFTSLNLVHICLLNKQNYLVQYSLNHVIMFYCWFFFPIKVVYMFQFYMA